MHAKLEDDNFEMEEHNIENKGNNKLPNSEQSYKGKWKKTIFQETRTCVQIIILKLEGEKVEMCK